MRIIKSLKETYKYGKSEFSKDISKLITKKKKKAKSPKKLFFNVKQGKKVSQRKALSDLKRKVNVRINVKKAKYKRKSAKEVKRETFGMSLNI